MKNFKVGDSILCMRSDTHLAIKPGKRYTVVKLGSISNKHDEEYVQLAELPGCAFKVDRFMLCTSK
jgi:hypothetical protein